MDGQMDVRELKNALRDLQVTISDENIMALQKEMDTNDDGKVSIPEVGGMLLTRCHNIVET